MEGERDRALAGAVLARDEDVGVGGSDALDELQHRLHLGGGGDQPQGSRLLQRGVLRLEPLAGAQGAAQLHLGAHDGQQPRVVPGLGHEVPRSPAHRLHRQLHARPCRHHHDGQGPVDRLQAGEQVEPLLAGGRVAGVIQVHEEKIELAFRQGREQVRWGAHGFKDISVRLEKQLQSIQHVLLIVGNENSAFGRLRIGGCLGCDH